MVFGSEQAVALAILRLVEQEKAVVEGAGAAGVAAILDNQLPELKGKRSVRELSRSDDAAMVDRLETCHSSAAEW